LKKNPKTAQSHWQNVQQQLKMLWSAEQLGAPSSNTSTLQNMLVIVAHDENISHLDTLLKQQSLSINLTQLPHELESLGNYSSFVTTAVTCCMVALGGILTLLTAWDLSRWMQALISSRDLNIRLQEEERRRIAGELHDGVMQDLIDLKRRYAPEKLDGIVHNLRRVCQNLKPQVLVDLGLCAALEALATDLREAGVSSVRMALDVENLTQLPASSELALFRVVQELFSNIRKHAGAQQVIVTLIYHPKESPYLRGYIQDDGCGFDIQQQKKGSLGLAGVRERIGQLGGSFKIESQPGKGSQFYFQIPLSKSMS
jgi:two-component system sensor histidine kinase DegS